MCCDHVEGGLYIGPEFQLGQVYDGGLDNNPESVLLYRPVYVCIPNPKFTSTPSTRARMLVDHPHEGGSAGGGASMKKSSRRLTSTATSMLASSSSSQETAADKTSTM